MSETILSDQVTLLLAQQARWSASALAKQCGVSTDTLRRHFVKHTGKPTKSWLIEQRQSQAMNLLSEGIPIKEIAAHLGYKHQTNFTRKFKEFWGVCPSIQAINGTGFAKHSKKLTLREKD